LISGYANNLITGDEVDYMLDITMGVLSSIDVEF